MQSKRLVVLMGILLAGWTGGTCAADTAHSTLPYPPPPAASAPLPGVNGVSGVSLRRDDKGGWWVGYDYFYTGEPARAQIATLVSRNAAENRGQEVQRTWAVPGRHHTEFELQHPGPGFEGAPATYVTVLLRSSAYVDLASEQVSQRIAWPSYDAWAFEQQMAKKSNAQIVDEAVTYIDDKSGEWLGEAKKMLEYVIARDPRFDAAYIEMARVAMKTKWGPEGLHQAEGLLKSALQIRPDSVNAKILLGYVHAHEKRYASAEALFVEAARDEPKNLWLWTNWGELLSMQGKEAAAIDKYRQAVTRPRTYGTYDRARLAAYEKLLDLLDGRKDVAGMEALQKQRADEYGRGSCYGVDYASFMLEKRGDATQAIMLGREALGGCREDKARVVLGLAYYVGWAAASGKDRDDMLNQARVYLPPGALALYRLASGEKTFRAAEQLVAAGESIDQPDNARYPALAHAMRHHDYAAARRLLKLGAKPDALVGHEQIPLALLPVMAADLDGIRFMREAGVDYTQLRFQGTTAIDHARELGDRQLLEALDPKGSRL